MLINDVTTSGAVPALEMTMRFAAQRQRLIAGNIANIATPGYQQTDVDPKSFQRVLADATQRRRAATGGHQGELNWRENDEIRRGPRSGELVLSPATPSGNILYHDRGNRDVERLMQAQAENAVMFRVAVDMLRSRFQLLQNAMSERVG